jgi:hypothetical protein
MVESKFSRNVHLPPWGTTLGVTPTIGCTGRWGQFPATVGHGGRIPSVVAHGGRSPRVVAHDGKALVSWPTAAAPAYIRGRAPAAGPSLTPTKLRLSTIRSTSEVCSKI